MPEKEAHAMEGLISSYELSSDIGRRVAEIKGLKSGWSAPTVLSRLLAVPGSLVMYEKLYLDQRGLLRLFDASSDDEKQRLEDFVLSENLDLFEVIDVADVLTVEDPARVEEAYEDLRSESAFWPLVEKLEARWGHYASPSAANFEAMNLPLTAVLLERLSKRFGTRLALVDESERALLHRLHAKRQLVRKPLGRAKGFFSKLVGRERGASRYSEILTPEIAGLLVDLAPKVIMAAPYQAEWSVDDIRRMREDKNVAKFRKSVASLARRVEKEYGRRVLESLGDAPQSESEMRDLERALEEVHRKTQQEAFDQLTEDLRTLQNRVSVSTWSVAGGFLACGGAATAPVLPPLALALGVTGGALILAEQTANHFTRQRCGWVEFLEYVAALTVRP